MFVDVVWLCERLSMLDVGIGDRCKVIVARLVLLWPSFELSKSS